MERENLTMDPYDPTNILFTKIKSLEPENASKIIGYLLIQDIGKKGLMCLAFGPETLLHSLILQAKTDLGLLSNTLYTLSTPSSPSPLNPISRPNSNTSGIINPLLNSSPRFAANGLLGFAKNPSSPSSNSWSLNNSANNGNPISPKSSPFLSYDNIRAGSRLVPSFTHQKNGGFVAGGGGDNSSGGDFIDEHQLSDYLSFLNDSSSKNEEFIDPRVQYGHSMNNGDTHLHRRSFSVSDACLGSEDADFGMGYKPCLYFARGFCKNGDNCKFVHGGFADNVDVNDVIVGSHSKMDYLYQQQQHEEMRRMKAAHHQRLAAAQFMAGVSQLPYDKSMNFILRPQHDPQRAAALMLDEECYPYSPGQLERNDMVGMGLADRLNSASRQIYLTFPADSTFKDEDVSNYFSIFGPVQDVRIPYQQKRMFGFVTFLHPETVKLILARGNPHFICDSRVLVKPYKEKGKVLDKKQQHLQLEQIERGKFSPCSSPSEIDSREQYDFHLGAKVFYNSHEMLLRRKLEEQADLQHAIEFQRIRLMNLQLPDLKNECIHNHQRSLSVGSPVYFPSHVNQDSPPYENIDKEIIEVNSDSPAATIPPIAATAEQQLQPGVNATSIDDNGCGSGKEESSNSEKCNLHERSEECSVEHVLPDNLFTSPTKFVDDQHSDLSTLVEVNEGTAKFATSYSSENNPALPTPLH